MGLNLIDLKHNRISLEEKVLQYILGYDISNITMFVGINNFTNNIFYVSDNAIVFKVDCLPNEYKCITDCEYLYWYRYDYNVVRFEYLNSGYKINTTKTITIPQNTTINDIMTNFIYYHGCF